MFVFSRNSSKNVLFTPLCTECTLWFTNPPWTWTSRRDSKKGLNAGSLFFKQGGAFCIIAFSKIWSWSCSFSLCSTNNNSLREGIHFFPEANVRFIAKTYTLTLDTIDYRVLYETFNNSAMALKRGVTSTGARNSKNRQTAPICLVHRCTNEAQSVPFKKLSRAPWGTQESWKILGFGYPKIFWSFLFFTHRFSSRTSPFFEARSVF